jgi:hypothetical protein
MPIITILLFISLFFSNHTTDDYTIKRPINVIEEKTYDIIWRKKVLGTAYAFKSQIPNGYKLYIASKINTRFIIDINVLYVYETDFINNTMISSKVYNLINGKVQNDIKITKEDNYYKAVEDGKTIKIPSSAIHHTLSSIYFAEPKSVNSAFSEPVGDFGKIKYLGSGIYYYYAPTGNDNIFHYVNGHLDKIEIKYTLADFTLKLKDQKTVSN